MMPPVPAQQQAVNPSTTIPRPPVKPPPRLNYKKSRTGCQRCRSRRVKCDEVHPICGSCRRHQALCFYDRHKPAENLVSSEVGDSNFTSDSNLQLQESSADASLPQESRKRRLLELKLLQHYMAKTARTMPGSASVLARDTWHTLLPDSALGNDGLLYMLYSLSALHMAKLEPQNLQAMDSYRTYFDMGLQEHSKDICRMGKDNADAICSASSFIRIIAFAILQDRPVLPYTAPTEWLQTTSGAASIFREAWCFIEDDPNSVIWGLLRTPPMLHDRNVLLAESNRQGLLHLLQRRPSEVAWDEETRKAYEDSTSYIGGVQNAIASNERTADICRRLMAFPMVMSKRFIALAKELQPRALVILAHYFALLAKLRDIWWIGDTGRREIRGIQTVLPNEWQDLMTWPLMTMEEKFLSVGWGDELP